MADASDASRTPHEHDAEALPPGTRLGDFEILRTIGSGGFGKVYLARDIALDRDVAIKEYLPTQLACRTPGSQFVVVKLPKTGSVILTSDVVYLKENLDKNLIPPIPGTHSPRDAYESYAKIRHIRDVENAKLFIGHDPELFKAAKKAPEFYD